MLFHLKQHLELVKHKAFESGSLLELIIIDHLSTNKGLISRYAKRIVSSKVWYNWQNLS